ncbi:protein shisa-like-1a [Pleurodeles waltl]|uniref:protein shisa-like-1a n=1 Tax=Pleurodeles waltl TaxID=8319 RepID=UPI003709646D
MPSSLNSRMCEGYYGWNNHYHSGFYCPRLSDPAEQIYCCDPGNHSLKYCCSQVAFEALKNVNLSELLSTAVYRSPLPLLGVGFYGLLIFFMMVVDFLYFYRLNQQSFYNMLNQRRIGKYLMSTIFRRENNPSKDNKDISTACGLKERTEATAHVMTDIKCEK